MKYNIVDRYIGKAIFNNIILTLFMLVSLSSIIKFFDQLKKVGQGSYNVINAGIYIFFTIPKDIHFFFPIATLLGSLLGLGALAQYNELIIMQASGFTRMEIALSAIKTTVFLTFISMMIGELIAPYSEEIGRNYRAKSMYGCTLFSMKKGLWTKDGNNFVYIEHIKDNKNLIGVHIYNFHHQSLQSIRHAEIAKFDSNKKLWNLLKVDESNLKNLKKINFHNEIFSTWRTNLTPDKLSIVARDPSSFSILDLYDHIKYLKFSGQNVWKFQFNMWSKVFQPFSILVMMLMSISFIYGPLRDVSIGTRIITGISFGFLFYILDHTFGPLTLVYNIPPIISAILPSIFFFFISLQLLLKSR